MEALRAPAYTAFLLRFGRWIETAGWRDEADRAVLDRPLARLAGRLLDKRHARVLKHGRDFERLSDDRLHRLRIALKKLRYAGEFFAAQFPDGRPRPYIKAVRRLQDDLGRLNDAAVAERRLSELLRAQPESAALVALGVGAGQVIGWHARARGGSRPDQRRLARLRRRRTLLACRERPVAWLMSGGREASGPGRPPTIEQRAALIAFGDRVGQIAWFQLALQWPVSSKAGGKAPGASVSRGVRRRRRGPAVSVRGNIGRANS